jgi:aryl-alcohol dehydrogenase-like predicted oxidoreductase
MVTERLGVRGPEITRLGFGSWAVGGSWQFGWGAQDDEQSVAAIRHAVEAGVGWIDTAPVYGFGHSEEVVGRALEPYRLGEEVLVFTKCGRVRGADGGPVGDLTAASIRRECEASLRRLRVERIDLYQFHWPETRTGTPLEESWSVMADLVDEGKVRFAGVSNFGVDLLERCEPIQHVDSLQPPLSLVDRRAEADVIPWCRAHGTGVIVYSPTGSGLLTGAFDHARLASLPADDWRLNPAHQDSARFREPLFSRALELVERLRPIADRLGTTLPALAVAWTLHVPGVTGAIVGARSPEQVDGWLPAADVQLADDDLRELERALTDTVEADERRQGQTSR